MILRPIMANIVCYLKGQFVVYPEQVTLGVDDSELAVTTTVDGEIHMSIDLEPGSHVFWVRLHNRSRENQVYDPSGINSQETFVEIDNIKIDNCMMNILVHDCGHTCIDWYKHPDVADWFQKHRGHVPEQLHKSRYLGLAGCYKFQFEYPVQPWLKDQVQIHKDYKCMYNAPIEKFLDLKKMLSK